MEREEFEKYLLHKEARGLLLAEFDGLKGKIKNQSNLIEDMGKRGAELTAENERLKARLANETEYLNYYEAIGSAAILKLREAQSWLDKICESMEHADIDYVKRHSIPFLREYHHLQCADTLERVLDYLDSQKPSEKPEISTEPKLYSHRVLENDEPVYHKGKESDCPICHPKPTKCPECGGTRQWRRVFATKWAQDMSGTRGFRFRHTPECEYVIFERCPCCNGEGIIARG